MGVQVCLVSVSQLALHADTTFTSTLTNRERAPCATRAQAPLLSTNHLSADVPSPSLLQPQISLSANCTADQQNSRALKTQAQVAYTSHTLLRS